MKTKLIFLLLVVFILGGCKNRQTENEDKGNGKKISEHYLNFDDELEQKSVVAVDTVEFRKIINRILPAKRIVELFGNGYQVFYMGLSIDVDGKITITLSPDASFWITGMGEIERMLFKENLEIAKNYAIIPGKDGDSKAVDIKDIFYTFDPNVQSAFKGSPGILNGKKVRSMKIFQIDATLDYLGGIVKPWTIKELDIAKLRPHIITGLGREYYLGFFPAVLREDFKFIGQSIGFPREAVARGVRGRVLIKLFYESDGEYAGYQLIKGLGYGCDEAVINTIEAFKPKSYASGQRSTVLVPFNFGPSDKTPVDISVKSFEVDPQNPHNKFKMVLVNKIKQSKVLKTKYTINVLLDGKLLFSDNIANLNWDSEKGVVYWFGGDKILPGEHSYEIIIDPENVLNDIDRSNNVVKGKIFIK